MRSAMKLSYHLNKQDPCPLYLQLYQQIRLAIHQQQLQLGEKLPSKRQLCEFLQISQNTVESAYMQLQAEGYIESKARRGFFVSFQAELQFSSTKIYQNRPHFSPPNDIQYDLNPNYIDTQHFPFLRWQKCGRYILQKSQKHLLALGEKQGDLNLRSEIAHYLAASRGVYCEPEQIIIGAGIENCLQQLILLFNQRYPQRDFSYAMESHGYHSVEKILHSYQKQTIKLSLSADNYQLNIAELYQYQANVAYITPAHIYPFGTPISISQRQQLLEWANAAPDRYLIEDDYDSEFRYQGKPIPALQSLDVQEKVIYFGSFSKLFMPSLRTAFMVLPKSLLADYQQYCGFFNCSVSRFEQQRLAQFMQQGEFEKHIHRMRKIYRKKMALLCQLFQPYSHKIRYYGEHCGVYLLIELINEQRSVEHITQRAEQEKIKLYPVYFQQKCLFSLGFGNLTEQALESAVKKLITIFINQEETP
ncbi:PLP-dependent aminotransferase family protein [Conservatibacter flavescens]|uniref:PLP-dependent aminotransferase family protein n=1 Tax=Conservatibacter flavescens TaxID=28161 RepID=A0A2M8S1H4_9PAST|nr:PLP-dependent aminotransferase family protein [Conservatibacter flavescens]PJG84968.1 PLP-dependent aminotransferase family protein [Conservatibacter flavescens]